MVSKPPIVQPDWTLSELKTNCPGVELTLFAHFGIGSRERAGFSGSELLHDLLRRHLVFDAEKACQRLTTLAQEDWQHSVDTERLANSLRSGDVVVVDARSEAEFEWCHIADSQLLSKETVEGLQASPRAIVTVCKDGTQAPAASRVLRKLGLNARHLFGGLVSWSFEQDPNFPILFPLMERPGFWYLLADAQTLRFRRAQDLGDRGFRIFDSSDLRVSKSGTELLKLLPGLEMVVSTPKTFSVRGTWSNLPRVIALLPEELRDDPSWDQGGQPTDEVREQAELARVLAEVAPTILASHKGTVVAESYQDHVLTLALGGGCAGCASAEITTQRELAASLYRAVPLLDGIRTSEP